MRDKACNLEFDFELSCGTCSLKVKLLSVFTLENAFNLLNLNRKVINLYSLILK